MKYTLLRTWDFEELTNNHIMLNITALSSNWLGQFYFLFLHTLTVKAILHLPEKV